MTIFFRRPLAGVSAVLLLAGSVIVGSAAPASAAHILRFSTDGGVSWEETIVDVDSDGSITYLGSIGTFLLDVTIGNSTPVIGSATDPTLSLFSLDVSSYLGGSLTIEHTDTDFTGTGTASAYISTGILGGTVQYTTYWNAGEHDSAFGGTLMTDSGVLTGYMENTEFGPGPSSSGYTLTQRVDLNFSGKGAALSSATLQIQSVPEPASVTLFAASLLLLGTCIVCGARPNEVHPPGE